MLLNCSVGEDSWESLGLQGDPTSPFWRRSALGFLWREWWWSWNSSTLATSCEELTHWKRLWCWEGLGAGGKGDDRGWDGWMASPTPWTWVWVNSRSWWTGRPGMLWFMGSQRVGHDWATELNWTEWVISRLDKERRVGKGTQMFVVVEHVFHTGAFCPPPLLCFTNVQHPPPPVRKIYWSPLSYCRLDYKGKNILLFTEGWRSLIQSNFDERTGSVGRL